MQKGLNFQIKHTSLRYFPRDPKTCTCWFLFVKICNAKNYEDGHEPRNKIIQAAIASPEETGIYTFIDKLSSTKQEAVQGATL